VVHPSGVEPEETPNKHGRIALVGHKSGHTIYAAGDAGLKKVIKAWPALPPPLKGAILAIVSSLGNPNEPKPA
jgi:hypothetical protein